MKATKVGVRVMCTMCGKVKKPHGRSAPVDSWMCVSGFEDECKGYQEAPRVGCLWPGETDADFGYACCDYGTEPVA